MTITATAMAHFFFIRDPLSSDGKGLSNSELRGAAGVPRGERVARGAGEIAGFFELSRELGVAFNARRRGHGSRAGA